MLLRDRVGGNLFEFLGMRRTDDCTQVPETSVPFHNLVGNGVERLRIVARVIAADDRHVLEIVCTLVARAEQHVGAVLGVLADERADGIGTHPRRNRHGICLVHVVGGSRIRGTRLADVAALCIQNNGNARAPVVGNQLLQHKHRLHAHAFVIGAVGFYHGGLHVTAQCAFQNVGIEALDFLFGAAFERDKLQDRVHAEAYRVPALRDSLFEKFVEIRHYLSSS